MKKEDLKLAIQSLMESFIYPELQRNEKHQIGERYEIKGFELASEKIVEFLEARSLSDFDFEPDQHYDFPA